MKNRSIFIVISFLLTICIIGFIYSQNRGNIGQSGDAWKENIVKVVEVYSFEEDFESYGTAFFVRDGILATNFHVVSRLISGERSQFENIQVRFFDEDKYTSVSLLSYDEEEDWAFLKYEGDHDYDKFSVTSDVCVGLKCFSIGNYANYGLSYKEGVVSLASVNLEYNGKNSEFLMISMNIGQGDSGAPIFNDNGELLGMVTFRSKNGGTYVEQGVAFGIPSGRLLERLRELN